MVGAGAMMVEMPAQVASRRPLALLQDVQSYRTLLFLATALPLGAVGLAVLIVGWTVCVVLAITPLVVPALVGFRATVGLLARCEAALARGLLGVERFPRGASAATRGFWGRGVAVLGDGGFWKQQTYLLLRASVGWALGIAELSLVATGLAAIALPIYYRWSDTEIASGWAVDTLPRALLGVPAGVACLVVALALVRPLAAMWRSLARALLPVEAGGLEKSPAESRADRRRSLAIHADAFAALNLLLILIWALTSRGYFWPVWTLLPLGLPLAIHAWVVLVENRPEVARRQRLTQALAMHEGMAVILAVFFVVLWAVTGAGYFWPVWPILGLLAVFGLHAAIVFGRGRDREELTDRIEVLETTRAGAVDLQESELRRIERDLHDGAQARLVALGMSLGMAEQKLRTDPGEAAEILAEARQGAQEALVELRDLARGIHPPVLTDRGLEAAVTALADRQPLPVDVSVDLVGRLPGTVETAAYFVVAEALANAGKHAAASRVAVRIGREDDLLVVEVADDGRGGANLAGAGLTGLRRRVEALDGTLQVASPAGGPTVLRAELPCAS